MALLCVCLLGFPISSCSSKFSLTFISHLPWSLACVVQHSWNSFFDSCSSYAECTIMSALHNSSFVVIRSYIYSQLSWNRFLSILRNFYISKLVYPFIHISIVYWDLCHQHSSMRHSSASCTRLRLYWLANKVHSHTILRENLNKLFGQPANIINEVRVDWQVSKSV